eukprot:2563644-Amphidinium_carterae.1
MNADAELPHFAGGLKLELLAQHDAASKTDQPIPSLGDMAIAPRLEKDDEELSVFVLLRRIKKS